MAIAASNAQCGDLPPLEGREPDELIRTERQVFTKGDYISAHEISETIAQAVIAHRVSSHPLLPLAEVCQGQDASSVILTHIAENVWIISVDHGHLAPRKRLGFFAHGDEPLQTAVDLCFQRVWHVATIDLLPIGERPVHPTAIAGFGRIVAVGIVVERAHLIAQVDQWDAADGEDDAVDQQNAADGQIDLATGSLVQRLFQTCQRCARAGNPAVAGPRVFLKRQAAGEAAGEAARVEGVEKLPVPEAVDPHLRRVLVVEGPADVVVTAHIVDPGAVPDRS